MTTFILCTIFFGIGILIGIDIYNFRKEKTVQETKLDTKICDHEFENTLVPELDGRFLRNVCKNVASTAEINKHLTVIKDNY